ncbi:MAG TPA: acetoacetyl-CoA reductase [Alphaproteobacteria bacterium]|nr:acetoacetyl-CoA reductase [Alphaproteobacteria bacterium]USO06031.1 MAG: acetoacetyl-CoA reductase [Rhodospirillales bacterium]HOO81821.1 acetoacetyl-CoA reductase [Alphaproteobacteria bacterium]
MTNKVAIVTGGTRGIGLEISRTLMADGYKVAAFYAGNEPAAKAFEKETKGRAFKVDVADLGKCEKAVARVEKELGPIGVLVNNAGITRDGMLHKMSDENWHVVIETNLTSCFNMCRAVVGGMRDRGAGRIVNISSINGQKGQLGQANYSAAKAGMLGFTKALALESARKGITVNAICPGYVKTEMTEAMDSAVLESIVKQIPVGRMGTPKEIAAIVSFLVSERAAFITGATLSANGGQYMV